MHVTGTLLPPWSRAATRDISERYHVTLPLDVQRLYHFGLISDAVDLKQIPYDLYLQPMVSQGCASLVTQNILESVFGK